MNYEEKIELATRAAWLSYIGGVTQQDIANSLNLSRQTSQRLIAYAKEIGIVNITISSSITKCLELEEQLRNKFSLKFVKVAPCINQSEAVRKNIIYNIGANTISNFILNTHAGSVIGFGSGRFLKNSLSRLNNDISRPDISCVSNVGAFALDGSCSQYEVTALFAEKTKSKRYMLAAPIFTSNISEKKFFTENELYKNIKSKNIQADPVFLGIGQVFVGCQINESGFITKDQIEDLQRKGAIGEINGFFFDKNGKRIISHLDILCTSFELDTSNKKTIIAICGGKGKALSLKAAMIAKYINGLVTDEQTAMEILENT